VEREDAPAQFDPVLPVQAIGTHGTEIAPGSDIIEKDLHHGRTFHDFPSLNDFTAGSKKSSKLFILNILSIPVNQAIAQSSASTAFAAGSDDAGFCPVIRFPSQTTWACQSAPLE